MIDQNRLPVETQPTDKAATSKFDVYSAIFAVIALVVGSGVFLWYSVYRMNSQETAKCDNAIRATLKAPSTYKRVSGPGAGLIEYDADNLFGVPLRSKGICTIASDGKVDWIELTSLDPR